MEALPTEGTWIFPTLNSEYEVDFNLQRARQITGERTTECFTPQGEWRFYQTVSFGYGATLVFNWTPSAPHHMTVTSTVQLDRVRASYATPAPPASAGGRIPTGDRIDTGGGGL